MMSHKTKQERRDEAVERQARYDALSAHEKFELVLTRPGQAARELRRLGVAGRVTR